ncbi:MAG TPA: hypothetical protein VE075_10680 [Thermoanaerobaculia bacterium]|nr:hypothetical protein [Thermoanaerobaculia bacterium]
MSRRLLLAAWIGFAAAAQAVAGPVVFMPFGGEGTLHPGQAVEVQWSGAPWGVEEMELLLSLDGGRHFGVRLTPDLDAERRSWSWRVPPFQSSDARLAIRVNLDGREVLAGVSEPFRIAAAEPGAGAAGPPYRWPMRAQGGELWVTGSESGWARPEVPYALTPAACGRSLASGWPWIAAAAPPSPRPAPSPPAPVLAGQADPGAAPLAAAHGACRQPPITPLRI